jgi:hypothetical protein
MKNKTIMIGLIILFTTLILSIFYAKSSVILPAESKSMMTKAICDEKNYCEDYEITCENKKVTKITPTGAAVQFSDDWEDPRTEEYRKIACD